MKHTIYVQLMDEGVAVFRPILAIAIGGKNYKIDDNQSIYNPNDETWEFLPGDIVEVEQRIFDGDVILVASKLAEVVP